MIVNKMPTGINNKIIPNFTYTGNYQVVDDGDDGWRIKFLSSGTLKLSRRANVDVFLVGGGGGGAIKSPYAQTLEEGGGGGAGGYTWTYSNENIQPNTNYQIVVGKGGESLSNYSEGQGYQGNSGETTTFSGPNGYVLWVPGGGGGEANYGGNGGSGGGNGGEYSAIGDGPYINKRGWYGGSNGGNGGCHSSMISMAYNQGQVSTTREFGEEDGTLYSGGGGGGSGQGGYLEEYGAGGAGGGGRGAAHSSNAANGEANTGGGGGGGHYGGSATSAYNRPSGAGGSGIVIIRNHRS